MCDLGLKTIVANTAPSLLINNGNSILSTLCKVPMECVEKEVPSSLAKKKYYEHNRIFANICDKLEEIMPHNCELGLVGYQALNVDINECDLDMVVIGDTIEELNSAKEALDSTCKSEFSEYISTIWPLSKRTKRFGSIDFFYSTRDYHTPFLSMIEDGVVLESHFEFEGRICDDSKGLLGIPIWELDNGIIILGLDNALRGRLNIGHKVTGLGILVLTQNTKIIVVQAASNISTMS